MRVSETYGTLAAGRLAARMRLMRLMSNPATRVQFGLGAVLRHSKTPSLRVAGFEDEDDDEDENEAPGETGRRRPANTNHSSLTPNSNAPANNSYDRTRAA
jgi:hypothetical protein